MTSASELSLEYVIGDVITSVQLPVSFQEQLLFEENERALIYILYLKNFERYQSDCLLSSTGSYLVLT